MAHRFKEGQERHDRGVAREAKALQVVGYNVQADLPEHPKPPTLNGRVPDVYATLARSLTLPGIQIIEVETRQGDDLDQHQDLRNWALRNGARFSVVLV